MVLGGIPLKKETINDHETVLAVLIRGADWENGLTFVSSQDDYLQVGTWRYGKGTKLLPHIHKTVPRRVLRTQEVVFVKKGRVKADIYTEKHELLRTLELGKNDALILLCGGHGFEVLDDDTQVLEVKNGPYVGADSDRERL
ncbi:MAG: hypothetical protein NWF05_12125 [Candidatus Bathyarchaeota archaeon]|nr:hypothetical protein [Candidatus Bathyarchaeota archaeon]